MSSRRCHPQHLVEHGLLLRLRQLLVRQRKAEERPIENWARARATSVDSPTGSSGLRHSSAGGGRSPARGAGGRIDAGPGADRVLQRQPLAEHPAQQQAKRIFVRRGSLDAGDDRLRRNLAPMLRIAAWNAEMSVKCQ